VQLVELTPGGALDQQRDVVAQRSAVEPGVHIVHDALDCGLRNRGVATGQTPDHLVDDRLFTQLDHTQSLAPVHPTVNLGRRGQLADKAIMGSAG